MVNSSAVITEVCFNTVELQEASTYSQIKGNIQISLHNVNNNSFQFAIFPEKLFKMIFFTLIAYQYREHFILILKTFNVTNLQEVLSLITIWKKGKVER